MTYPARLGFRVPVQLEEGAIHSFPGLTPRTAKSSTVREVPNSITRLRGTLTVVRRGMSNGGDGRKWLVGVQAAFSDEVNKSVADDRPSFAFGVSSVYNHSCLPTRAPNITWYQKSSSYGQIDVLMHKAPRKSEVGVLEWESVQ